MPTSVHILLVEDNRMDVELTLDAFREGRLMNSVHVAPDGPTALDYLFGRGQYADRETYPIPDLILLDLKLPGMNGFEVLTQIKSTPILKRLPVVILTSSNDERDRLTAYDRYANSFVQKPVDHEQFVAASRQLGLYWLVLNEPPPPKA